MKVFEVPMLSDNYAYLLVDEKSKIAAVVDPVEPKKIINLAKELGVEISAILTTHHHWDHAGGNEELVSSMGGSLEVYGGDERIQKLTKKVSQDDSIQVGGLVVKVHFTPCHTSGHVLYYVEQEGNQVIFTGDTLFIGGCGRFFEGTAAQMYEALIKRVASLPAHTKIYCGHEYTVKNLEFALSIEPENEALKKKLSWAKEQRSHGKPTIPSTISEELSYNPFMRVTEKSVALSVGSDDPIQVMKILRERKDAF